MSDSNIINEIGFVREQIERIEDFRRPLNASPNGLDSSNKNGQSLSPELQETMEPVGLQNMTAMIEVTNVDEDGKPTSNEAPHVTVKEVKNAKDKTIQIKGGALPQKGGNELKNTTDEIAEALSKIDLTASRELKTKVDDLVSKLNEYEDGGDLTPIFQAADEVNVEAEKAETAANPEGTGQVTSTTDNSADDKAPVEVPGANADGGGKRRSRRRRRHSSKKKKKKKSRRRKGSRRK
jgi:hypothetical protein